MISISWTLVDMGASLNPTMQVGVNGAKSMLTILMQFLPVIILVGAVWWLIGVILRWVKGFSFGWKSKWWFTSTQKH